MRRKGSNPSPAPGIVKPLPPPSPPELNSRCLERSNADREADLILLAEELYLEGYACGISRNSDTWYKAWAKAMHQVCAGAEYTDMMVIDIYKTINSSRS